MKKETVLLIMWYSFIYGAVYAHLMIINFISSSWQCAFYTLNLSSYPEDRFEETSTECANNINLEANKWIIKDNSFIRRRQHVKIFIIVWERKCEKEKMINQVKATDFEMQNSVLVQSNILTCSQSRQS